MPLVEVADLGLNAELGEQPLIFFSFDLLWSGSLKPSPMFLRL